MYFIWCSSRLLISRLISAACNKHTTSRLFCMNLFISWLDLSAGIFLIFDLHTIPFTLPSSYEMLPAFTETSLISSALALEGLGCAILNFLWSNRNLLSLFLAFIFWQWPIFIIILKLVDFLYYLLSNYFCLLSLLIFYSFYFSQFTFFVFVIHLWKLILSKLIKEIMNSKKPKREDE